MNIITLNVRGIRNRVKRRSLFSYLKDQNCHFYLLQETFSEPKDERVWKNEWGGDVFFSHGSNHSKGVCILVNPSIAVNVENSYKDIDGRIIAIDVICNGVNLSICNVYAPTSLPWSQRFFCFFPMREPRSGEKEKPLVTLDLNLTFMQTPAVKRVKFIITKQTNGKSAITCLPIKQTNHIDLRVCKNINRSEPEGQILTLASA